jgi:L-asparaginase
MRREKTILISILTTGGTIEKTYDEADGTLSNARPVLHLILGALRTPALTVRHVPVMSKDSQEMTDVDRRILLEAVRFALHDADAVLIVHGTDTLAITGEFLHHELHGLDKPVVLTGAMRPYEFRDTDAHQNVTEALLACRLVQPGVYVAMHNRVLRFPDVMKDRERMTFVPR